jgi:hypothetical protein
MKDKNVIGIDDHDIEDTEEFLEDSSAGLSAMMSLVIGQQNIALGLTKLVLEYGDKDKNIPKEEVFEIYQEAFDFLKEQI